MRGSLPRLPPDLVIAPEAAACLDRWSPITIVGGAQGYGKSTLVASWLSQQPDDVRAVWVSARRDGPAAFVRQLLLGLDGEPLEGEDPMAALDRVAFSFRDERLVLVVDDAHALRDDVLLQGLIDLVSCHHHVHLVLCSRRRHRVEQLAAGRVDVLIVPGRALLLTVDQITRLAELMEVPLTVDQAGRLHAAFGGWAAAARLVLRAVTDPADDLPLAVAEQYLRETVIPNVADPVTLQHVSRFALAERLTLRLIRDLSNDRGAAALVRTVEMLGLAERRYEGADVVLELPNYVQVVLREILTEEEPETARVMHGRLAEWFATHDGPDHALFALRHAAAGEAWELFDTAWTEHSARLGLESPAALGELLRNVPDSVITRRPGLGLARDVSDVAASAHGDPDGQMDVLRTYGAASRRLAAQNPVCVSVHDILDIGTGTFVALRLEGKLAEAEVSADLTEESAAPLIAAGQQAGDRLPWFNLQRGLVHTLRADHAAAIHRYQLCWRERRRTTPHVAGQAAANLALTHALRGDPAAANQWLGRHSGLHTGRTWARDVIDQGAHLAAGLLALDRLDTGRCASALERLGDGSTPLELWPYVASLHAQHQLLLGAPGAGIAVLDAALASHCRALADGGAAAALLLRARADLLLAMGQGQRAQALLDRHPGPMAAELAVVAARVSLLSGNPLGAIRISASHLWSDTTDSRARQDLMLLHAVAAHRLNDLRTSAILTRQALMLYAATGVLRSFAMLPAEDLDALLANAGATLLAADVTRLELHPTPFPATVEKIELTARERLLADALVSNATRQAIADQLYVSVNTVRAQLATLYRKLGVNTREEALARIAELQLRPDPLPQP